MTLLLRSPLVACNRALLLSLLLPGCTPLPESVGDGLSTSTDGGGDTSTDAPDSTSSGDVEDDSSGGAELGPEPKWKLLLEAQTACLDVAPMVDGGVVVIVRDYLGEGYGGDNLLRRYDPDGTLVWERPAGSEHFAVATLPDGRIVTGGGLSGEPIRAALWVLSPEGEVQATYLPPAPEDPEHTSVVGDLATDGSGVAFVVTHRDEESQPTYFLGFAGLDLEPQWWWSDFAGDIVERQVNDVQISGSGSIRTLESPDPVIRTFSTAGALQDELAVDASSYWLAKGDPGVLIERVPDDAIHLRGLEERPDLDAVVSQDELGLDFPSSSFEIFHRDGFLMGGALNLSTLWVGQLDASGALLYQRTLESDLGPFFFLMGIAPGPDESIYMCGAKQRDGTQNTGFLTRRYPQWG